jgi:hypothetical protein
MNRREKRATEKKLGILKYKNKLSKDKYFDRIRDNIIEGKKKEAEMSEVRRLQEEGKQEEIIKNNISSIATSLMVKEGLSYNDALVRAEKLYYEKTI